MNINERISHLRKEILPNKLNKKLSQVEFGKLLGIGRDVIGNIEYNRVETKEHMIKLICQTFNVREEWLKNGIEPIFIDAEEEELEKFFNGKNASPLARKVVRQYFMLEEKQRKLFEEFFKNCVLEILETEENKTTLEKDTPVSDIKDIQNLKQVKFYEIPASAGIGSLITDNVEYEIKEIDLNTVPHARKSDFALYIRGDSMEPNFYDGDVVFIKEQPYIEEGQIGIFIYENESYIKKYTTDKNGQVYLVSLNPKYEPIRISENNCFKICGVVL